MLDKQTGEAVVARINRNYPQLLQTNTFAADGEFLQRVCREPECVAQHVGLLSKSAGENGYTWPNGSVWTDPQGVRHDPTRTSHDVLAWPNGERVDIIQSAGAPSPGRPPGGPSWLYIAQYDGNGNLQWRPNNVYVDQSSWPLYDSGATGQSPIHTDFKLAFGWFCWMTAWAKWHPEAQQNYDWIMGEMAPEVFRVMLAVEGQSHMQHGNPDVWTDAAVLINDDWDNRFKRMLDQWGNAGLQGHLTVYGGRNQTPTHDDRRRFHDRIVAACQGRWAAIRSWEMMNEFKTNRWTAEEVRSAGADLAGKLPTPYKLSLSSPELAHGYVADGSVTGHMPSNEEMGASFDELYGPPDARTTFTPSKATEITIHTMRDGLKWSDPFAFNVFYPELEKINNEPPGPGASGGAEGSTAATVGRDLSNTMKAGWPMYVGHCEWVPWNGHLPPVYYNGWREIRILSTMPHMPECAVVMKTLTDGESPEPVVGFELMAGETLDAGEQLIAAAKTFQAKYDEQDGNFVIWTKEAQAVWSTQTTAMPAGNLQMNRDGNLVMYDGLGVPVWATNTPGHPNGMAQLQDDGYLFLYEDPTGPLKGQWYWRSNNAAGFGGVTP